MSGPAFNIANRRVGADAPPFVIAEMSGNHNQSLDRALAILDAAKAAGADAVKLQTYTPDTMTIDCDGPGFVVDGGLWDGRTLYDLYREAHTPWQWQSHLFARAKELGLIIFSTPFDVTAVDFLEDLGAPAYKVASFELVDLPLIGRIAATGKPIIMSTGMASVEEIDEAVTCARSSGCANLALLHCVSAYPTPAEQSNLKTIAAIAERWDVVVGLSDHTLGTAVATTAIALGAAVIEKHFTLARADGGPDAAFSLEPAEFATLCRDCRTAWAALGSQDFARPASEKGSLAFRRSIYAVADIATGETLTDDNVRCIRPGFGLPPKFMPQVIGRRARKAIARGTPLAWTLIE